MKSGLKVTFVLAVALLLVVILVKGSKTKVVAKNDSETPAVTAPVAAGATADQKQKSAAPVVATPPVDSSTSSFVKVTETPKTKEEASLSRLVGFLFEYTHKSRDPKKMIRELEQAGLRPNVTQDFNPDTGKMIVVRTNETLPGTRYFHAQFFEDADKQPYLQHLSFEFRPSPEAMSQAMQAVAVQFPGLKKPTIQRDDYVQWNAGNDYTVWIKRMSVEDLKDDPFNAHSKADVGTVRVAIEEDPHAHDDDDAH